jgi:RNA polymerase sigma-70 factor (ECF subfamily)
MFTISAANSANTHERRRRWSGAPLAFVSYVALAHAMPPSDDLPDDSVLAQRAKQGDRGAFEVLFRRHRTAIHRVIALRTRDDALAEEIAQVAFVRAFEAIETFRGDATFATWLYTIALNVMRNELRRRSPDRHVPLDDVDLITNALGTGKLVAREVRAKLAAAIADLPPKQRMIVELHLLHGLPFKAIAPLVDSTDESARRNYSHAVKRLRSVLLGDDP